MTFLSPPRHTFRFLTALAPAFGVLISCGAADEPKYPDVTSFCNARAKAECNAEVVKACAIVDASHCVSNRQAACLATVPSGTVYTPSGAETCVDAVSTAYGDAKLTAEENRSTGDVCARVFDGAGAANASCDKDLDCKVSSGLRCALSGGSASGTCQIPERVQGGGSCNSPKHMCVEGYHCGVTLHCDINGQVGEACNVFLPCAPTAQCNQTGTCVSKFNDGTPCTNDNECLHNLCARGTGSSQGLCVAQMTLAPNEPFCIDAR